MIKLKLSDLERIWPSFTQLLRYEFQANVAFDIFRMARPVKEVYQDFVNAREVVVRKHGVEEGGGYRVMPQNIPAFHEDMKPLLDKVIELPIEPLSMTVLLQNAPKTMAPSVFIDLEPFFKDDVKDINLKSIGK
jgi:hypothetical protein